MKRVALQASGANQPAYRVERQHVSYGASKPAHRHEFAELLWIEKGTGVHLVNGQRSPLFPGIVAMLRPDDRHTFQVKSRGGITFVSLSFPASTVDYLKARYFSEQRNFWSGRKPVPTHHFVSPRTIEQLATKAEVLATRPREWFFLEHFLIDIIYTLRVMPYGTQRHNAPGWLHTACERIRAPDRFVNGPNELARLAGRCAGHVARVAKMTMGKTPADIVNDARMDYAAAQLAMTDREIVAICFDCGFKSLSHFYKLFTARFKMSPRNYRLQEH